MILDGEQVSSRVTSPEHLHLYTVIARLQSPAGAGGSEQDLREVSGGGARRLAPETHPPPLPEPGQCHGDTPPCNCHTHTSSLQGITKIADLTACCNLTVLYLYNNKLKTIEALDSAPHIQLLYLQNNKIARMSGLDKLKKLKKLYLTRNRIQVLEGLLENKCLEELHVDRQASSSKYF